MMLSLRLSLLPLLICGTSAFTTSSSKSLDASITQLSATVGRREAVMATLTSSLGAILAVPSEARADVSDGNVLPQAARQFSRSVQLRVDVDNVFKRLSTAGEGDIDNDEWNNIGLFLRSTYQTADGDMKGVANGIFNPENKQIALRAVEKIKKISQAGDNYARKRDAVGLAGLVGKIQEAQAEFFDSLSDVPDEI